MIRKKKLDVVRGGIAIPIPNKDNYYYMSGRKHINGGIDLGKDPKTGLEVEDGEVVKIGKNDIKVFSAVPFQNGKSPAERVLGGENAGTVFKEQEAFKDRNGLNDDGTKKKRIGGQTTTKRKYITTLTVNEEKQFKDWYSKVAKRKNLNPNPDADGQDYDYRGYWKNEDRDDILGSNPNAHFPDKYKQPTHPTFSNESIYSNDKTPGGTWVRGKGTWLFKHNKFTARQADRTADYLNGTGEGFILGTDTIIPNIKKRMGGLSRSKDYGSKSKPYPSVKSGDFAGGHRSYPIPTKTDAIDALRLAGLHGRSDVRAKVYAKYPDLRKKSKSGGLYSVTVNGETKLKMFPSTGSLPRIRRKAALGTFDDNDETSQNNETDMSTTNNKPSKSTTLKEIVITPNNIEDETEKRIAKNEKRNRLINSYLSGYHGGAINLLSNIGGNIATTLINKRALNKMQAPLQPISQTATKLRTNYNINPQLDNLRETAARYEEAVNNNTASSRTALARNQQNRFATALNTNNLYGTKENEETKLINADRLNQQEVANKNVEAYNAWQDKVNAFKNTITEKKAENLVGLTQGITSGITSTIENVQQRMRDDKNILANALSHPNLPIEEFYHNGLISKRAYEAYRKAYPLKTDTKKED